MFAQSTPYIPPHTLRKPKPAARPKTDATPTSDLDGLTLTDDEKTKIDQIHKDILARMDNVRKDAQLSPEQKGAMLDGYRRIERNQVYQALGQDQQATVRKRVLARRADAMKEQEQEKEQKQKMIQSLTGR